MACEHERGIDPKLTVAAKWHAWQRFYIKRIRCKEGISHAVILLCREFWCLICKIEAHGELLEKKWVTLFCIPKEKQKYPLKDEGNFMICCIYFSFIIVQFSLMTSCLSLYFFRQQTWCGSSHLNVYICCGGNLERPLTKVKCASSLVDVS